MNQENALIGGTEGGEDKIWPSDWPCTDCGKAFGQHIKIGEPSQEWYRDKMDFGPARTNWCLPISDNKNQSSSFQPVDNLTYVELEAKKKGLGK